MMGTKVSSWSSFGMAWTCTKDFDWLDLLPSLGDVLTACELTKEYVMMENLVLGNKPNSSNPHAQHPVIVEVLVQHKQRLWLPLVCATTTETRRSTCLHANSQRMEERSHFVRDSAAWPKKTAFESHKAINHQQVSPSWYDVSGFGFQSTRGKRVLSIIPKGSLHTNGLAESWTQQM